MGFWGFISDQFSLQINKFFLIFKQLPVFYVSKALSYVRYIEKAVCLSYENWDRFNDISCP